MGRTMRVAWWRFRATLGHRRGGYVTIVLLIGIVGGMAMGAVAGARRTQSSFPAFLRSTNPSDLIVAHIDSSNDSNATDPAFLRAVARLPHVKHVESSTNVSEQVLGPDGVGHRGSRYDVFNSSATTIAYVDGEQFTQDRPSAIRGRLLDPKRPEEMNMSAGAAAVLHLHVGDVVPFDFYTNKQTTEPDYGTGKQKPVRAIGLKLVGIVVYSFEIVRDDFDDTHQFVIFSPALTNPMAKCCLNGPIAGLQLQHGAADDAAVEAEIKQSLPGSTLVKITSVVEATAERSLAPQSVALGVFGAIAALAALLISGQAIGRQLRAGSVDLETMRALGAGPGMTQLDGAIGVILAVGAGSVLAALIAVALSPIAPLGPVRHVYPSRGFAVDWTVLVVGVATLIVILACARVDHRVPVGSAPRRTARRGSAKPRSSRVAAAAAAGGVPVSGVAGLRLALDPGSRPARGAVALGDPRRGARRSSWSCRLSSSARASARSSRTPRSTGGTGTTRCSDPTADSARWPSPRPGNSSVAIAYVARRGRTRRSTTWRSTAGPCRSWAPP